MEIELNGFILSSSDTQLRVRGPDDAVSRSIGRTFLGLLKTEEGFDMIERYVEARSGLIQALGVPRRADEDLALNNLVDWLRDNPDWVSPVEDALKPYGYKRVDLMSSDPRIAEK